MSRIGIPNDSQKGYSPPASDESEFEIELSMSLINESIWSSSLATGSGVGGTTSVAAAVAAEADAEAPVETDGSPAASEGAETDEAIACGVAVDGALDEPRCPQPAMARPMSKAAAQRAADRADWRLTGSIS